MVTITELVHKQVGDHRVGLMFEDRTWTHHQVARAAAARAALIADRCPPAPPRTSESCSTTCPSSRCGWKASPWPAAPSSE